MLYYNIDTLYRNDIKNRRNYMSYIYIFIIDLASLLLVYIVFHNPLVDNPSTTLSLPEYLVLNTSAEVSQSSGILHTSGVRSVIQCGAICYQWNSCAGIVISELTQSISSRYRYQCECLNDIRPDLFVPQTGSHVYRFT